MSNLADEQAQVELETIETQQEVVMGEALTRLMENPDFNTVVMEGYLKDKVLASVSMLAHNSTIVSGKRPLVMEDLVAASNLNVFFKMVMDRYISAVTPEPDEEDFQEDEELN